MDGLSDDELERLHMIGDRIRATNPGLKLDTESSFKEGSPYYPCHLTLPNGARIGSVYHTFVWDGLLMASARSDETFMLPIIKRLLDERKGQEREREGPPGPLPPGGAGGR